MRRSAMGALLIVLILGGCKGAAKPTPVAVDSSECGDLRALFVKNARLIGGRDYAGRLIRVSNDEFITFADLSDDVRRGGYACYLACRAYYSKDRPLSAEDYHRVLIAAATLQAVGEAQLDDAARRTLSIEGYESPRMFLPRYGVAQPSVDSALAQAASIRTNSANSNSFVRYQRLLVTILAQLGPYTPTGPDSMERFSAQLEALRHEVERLESQVGSLPGRESDTSAIRSIQVTFESGSAKLTSIAQSKLREIREFPTGKWLISIVASADTTGSSRANLQLSRLRAEAVQRWLISNFDIPPTFISAVGVGETNRYGLTANIGENRRAVVWILKR